MHQDLQPWDEDSRELVGEKAGDPADIKICLRKSYLALAPGHEAYEWESPSRVIPNLQQVKSGPLTELHLARSPAAGVVGMVVRLRESSDQSIIQIFKDARRAAIYRVRAPGVRIKDGRFDGRLVDGARGLRKEGEQAQERLEDRALVPTGSGATSDDAAEIGISTLWSTVEDGFLEKVAAIELPDEALHPTLKVDWPLIGSVRRLEALTKDNLFKLEYVGQSCVTWRDFLRLRDIGKKPAGLRFVYYLARGAAHDFVSLTRKSGIRDWLGFAGGLLAFLSSLGSLGWLLSQLF